MNWKTKIYISFLLLLIMINFLFWKLIYPNTTKEEKKIGHNIGNHGNHLFIEVSRGSVMHWKNRENNAQNKNKEFNHFTNINPHNNLTKDGGNKSNIDVWNCLQLSGTNIEELNKDNTIILNSGDPRKSAGDFVAINKAHSFAQIIIRTFNCYREKEAFILIAADPQQGGVSKDVFFPFGINQEIIVILFANCRINNIRKIDGTQTHHK